MMRILVLLPILKNKELEYETEKELRSVCGDTIQFEVKSLNYGPASIESEFDDRVASPWVIQEVVNAEREGFDAVFVSCMGDIAINAARELVKIPVIAPYQTCMAVASTLGDKFGVITILENIVPVFYRKAREYGFDKNLAGVRSIDVPVLELNRRRDAVKKALVKEAEALVKEGADTIILGCTGLVGMARDVQNAIGIPVLDPTPVSVKFADMLVSAGLTHSRKAFQTPPSKERIFPGMETQSLLLDRKRSH
jgi:allantoin racemase